MAPGRILRIGLLRSFFIPRGPILPTTNRHLARSIPRAAHPRRPLTSRPYSTSPPPSSSSSSSPAPTTLTGRLKTLIKTHGWYALGVYTTFTVLDFSLTFAAIYLLGADHVNKFTQSVRLRIFGSSGAPADEQEKEAAPAGGGSEDLYAIAILAYGIHKTLLLPVRIGLTAAVTPRLVGFLTRRGWVGQGGATRAAQHVKDKVQRVRSNVREGGSA